MRFLLFGSRASGKARPDSDWDLVLVDDELVARLPLPWPFIDPRNTQVGDDTASRMTHFYTLWQAWSLETWSRFGGDEGIQALKERARRATAATYPQVGDAPIDLFIYTPPQLHPKVWGIRLSLDNRWALKEMGDAGKDFAILEYMNRLSPDEMPENSQVHTGLP